jgi:spore coat protein U-like protein
MRTRPATLAVAAFIALSLGVPWQASAACNATIQSIEPVPTIVYDPFDNDTETEDFEVTVRNNGNDDCTLTLAVAGSTPGSQRYYTSGASQLAYQAETPNGIPYPNNIAAPLGTTSLKGGNGREREIKVQLRVQAGLIAGAGTYADTLTFRLFDAAGASPVQLGTDRTAPAQARIEARAQLNIAGTSGSFGAFELDEIDFGALSTGATRNAVVQVRATRPVAITLSSQNQGLLKHQDLPSAAGVPYALQLDGASVDLTAGGFGLARTPALNLNGTNYPMTVTIIDTNGRAAGAYKDRLTITVTPQ